MILTGDCLEILPTLDAESVQCCVTSPPYYGLRDYRVAGQIGLERTYLEYVEKLVRVFREVWRVLRPDGTLWLNLGDSYASGKGTCFNPGGNTSSFNAHLKAQNVHPLDRGNKSTLEAAGLKPKDLIGIPWRVAFALQADGWYLRQDIIWAKPNPMPESVTDRCTKAHEYIFLLTKSARYFYDTEAIKEEAIHEGETRKASIEGAKNSQSIGIGDGPGGSSRQRWGLASRDILIHGRNRRSVWTISTKPFKEAHFATFPPELPEICIKAGTSEKGCCPECRSPWERVIEKGDLVDVTHDHKNPLGSTQGSKFTGRNEGSGWTVNSGTFISGHSRENKTTGWRPTCNCRNKDAVQFWDAPFALRDAPPYDPIPCTVLDPFSGAGTTGMVAEKLGRKYIGIELNPEYSEMSEKRIEAVRLPLFR